MAKEPQWRRRLVRAEGLFKPFSRLLPPPPIPSYVQRWLNVMGARDRRKWVRGEVFAARILTEACHSYYRLHADSMPFDFEAGRPAQPEIDMDAYRRMLEEIGLGEDGGEDGEVVPLLLAVPCVFNGSYAYFFSGPNTVTAVNGFKAWVTAAWNLKPEVIDKAGWPVIRLQKGDWPIDPRLLPGSPVAFDKLEEETAPYENRPVTEKPAPARAGSGRGDLDDDIPF